MNNYMKIGGCKNSGSKNSDSKNNGCKTKRIRSLTLCVILMWGMISLTGCGKKEAEVQLFAAASLKSPMEELIANYQKENPEITITLNADSSGILATQITEGYSCDLFFAADTKQMNTLTENGLVVEGTMAQLLENKVVLIHEKGQKTNVTGFENMNLAESMALADGSVPAGSYGRKIMCNLGILPKVDDVKTITTADVSAALGELTINECSNVSKVLESVKEGANEIGIVYLTDAYGAMDQIEIIAEADESLSGEIIYPIAQIVNKDADKDEVKAAKAFLTYLQSEEAKEIFEKYQFINK